VISAVAGSATYFNNPTGQAITQPRSNQNPCFDTDGGRIYTVQGTIYDVINSYRYTDVCTSSNDLTEFYCNGNQPKKENHICPNGCSNGACILPPQLPAPQPQPTPVPTPQPVPPPSTSLAATSCDADAVCEAKELITDSAEIGQYYPNLAGTSAFPTVEITPHSAGAPSQLVVYGPTLFPQSDVRVSKILYANKIGVNNPNPQAELDVVGKAKADYVETSVVYADAFKLGALGIQGCNPSLVFRQAGGPCGIVEVNSPLSVVEITAPQTTNEITIRKTVEVFGELGVQNDVESGGLKIRSQSGQGRSFACFEDNGRLIRSDTPCR